MQSEVWEAPNSSNFSIPRCSLGTGGAGLSTGCVCLQACWPLRRGGWGWAHLCTSTQEQSVPLVALFVCFFNLWHFKILPSNSRVVALFTNGAVLTHSSLDLADGGSGGVIRYSDTLGEAILRVLGTLIAVISRNLHPLLPPPLWTIQS